MEGNLEGNIPCAHCQPLNYWEGIPTKRASNQVGEWKSCLQKNQFCVLRTQCLCSGGLLSLKQKNQMKLQNFISSLNCHKSHLFYERKQSRMNGLPIGCKVLQLPSTRKIPSHVSRRYFIFCIAWGAPSFHEEGMSHTDTCGIIFIYTLFDWKMS